MGSGGLVNTVAGMVHGRMLLRPRNMYTGHKDESCFLALLKKRDAQHSHSTLNRIEGGIQKTPHQEPAAAARAIEYF